MDALNKLDIMNEEQEAENIERDVVAIAIDIQSQSHPIILFLHISLSLFQLKDFYVT